MKLNVVVAFMGVLRNTVTIIVVFCLPIHECGLLHTRND